jgi:hypothetical protein
MKMNVQLDPKSFDFTMDALRRFGKDAEKAVKKAVDRTAIAVETDAKNKLKDEKHIITNRLRASVHAELEPNRYQGTDGLNVNFGKLEAIAGTNVSYAPHIEFGTKPHVIVPKNKKFLAFKIGGVMIFTKKVNHPGFKGSSFMRFAAEKQKPEFEKRMVQELNKVINAGAKR